MPSKKGSRVQTQWEQKGHVTPPFDQRSIARRGHRAGSPSWRVRIPSLGRDSVGGWVRRCMASTARNTLPGRVFVAFCQFAIQSGPCFRMPPNIGRKPGRSDASQPRQSLGRSNGLPVGGRRLRTNRRTLRFSPPGESPRPAQHDLEPIRKHNLYCDTSTRRRVPPSRRLRQHQGLFNRIR